MLELWSKTPIDLGVTSWENVDPWWEDAMLEIKQGYSAQQVADAKTKTK